MTDNNSKQSRVVITLPKQMKHELKVMAAFNNKSLGKTVLSYINDGLEKNKKKLSDRELLLLLSKWHTLFLKVSNYLNFRTY